jgi:rhodanese-related sulfurtransferase
MNARKILTASALLGFLFLLLMATAFADRGCSTCRVAEKPKAQSTCPVMGGKINKDIYVDAEGYRIYACCKGCLPKIKADPEKYIKKIKAKGESPLQLKSVRSKKTAEVGKIDTAALAVLIKSEAPLVILDARTKGRDGRRIPGARFLSPKASAKEAAEAIGKDKDALVVTYCSNVKCPASKYLAKRLHKLGYKNVLKYPEGIEGWAAAGHKVETTKKK